MQDLRRSFSFTPCNIQSYLDDNPTRKKAKSTWNTRFSSTSSSGISVVFVLASVILIMTCSTDFQPTYLHKILKSNSNTTQKGKRKNSCTQTWWSFLSWCDHHHYYMISNFSLGCMETRKLKIKNTFFPLHNVFVLQIILLVSIHQQAGWNCTM